MNTFRKYEIFPNQMEALKEIHSLISFANKNPSDRTRFLLNVLDDIVNERQTPTPKISLFGKTIAFTGILSTRRDDAETEARKAGAKITNSVSRKTDYLVVGNDPGGVKLENAKQFGVRLLSEAEFNSAVS